jgi:predicted metal-binding transcription factor (methanogenesis marker protein 9)
VTRTLVPVRGQERCLGHLLYTCKGWRACDVEDRELGYFETDASASAAGHAGV